MIVPVFLSVIFFILMMLLRQLFEMAEILLEAQVDWTTLVELLTIFVISTLNVTVPMATLLGVLIGISRLTNDNEILALRVHGISIVRVFYPLLILAFAGAGGLMYMSFQVIPKAFQNLEERQAQISFEILTNLQPGRNHEGLSPEGADLYLYFNAAGERQPDDPRYSLRMEGVAMRLKGEAAEITGADVSGRDRDRRDAEGRPVYAGEQETLLFAREGVIIGDIDAYTFTIRLEKGSLIPLNRMIFTEENGDEVPLYRENREQDTLVSFATLEKTIAPERQGGREQARSRSLSAEQLIAIFQNPPEGEFWEDQSRGRVEREWRDYTAARNELFQRLTLPFALPAFVLIAIPLALELRPRAKSVSFLMAIALIVVYYVLVAWAGAAGAKSRDALPSLLLFLSPNVLLGGLGAILFWKLERA